MSAKERDRYNALISKPQEPLSYSAKSKLKQYIIHLYNTAISNKIETVNYGQNIVLDKASNKIKRRNFTKSEKDLLYKNDNDDIVKIILIYLELGFRLNELLSLPTWGSKTDAGKDRIIPLVGKAREYVKYFYGDGSQKFLIERNGKRIREEYFRIHMFYPTLDRLGIEYSDENSRFNVITPHRIRHTFAADSVKAGVAPEALKEIIGHAQYSTTINKYNDDVDVDYLKKELQKKGGFVANFDFKPFFGYKTIYILLPKQKVASSSLVIRSIQKPQPKGWGFFIAEPARPAQPVRGLPARPPASP